MFFGREDVFSFVRRNLTGRHRDAPIVLQGQRRTGKTSVLYQMHRHLDSRYRCIFIDLHGISLKGKENFLWGVANSIRRGLQRDHQLSVAVPGRATFSANPEAAFETTFLDTVWSILGEDHLLLMVDEAVRLHEEVRAGRLEREIFAYLRHLMQHYERLNFVFSLGSGVEEMKVDYAFLFGPALYHRISFLEPAAAGALITRPVQDSYQVTPDAVEKILQITTGHPYYTQLICHCMFDRWVRAPKPQMTPADVDAVLTEAIELGSANLTYVWEDSTPEEQAMMAGMAAARPTKGSAATVDQIRKVWHKAGMSFPEGEATRAIRNLTAREVVVASDGAYSFAVDLQRLWLDKHRRLDWAKEELKESARKWEGLQGVGTRRGRTRWLWAAGGVVAAVAVAVVVIFWPQHSAPAVRHLDWTLLKTGNCLTGSNLQMNTSKPWPQRFQVVPCSQKHLGEVYYSSSYWSADQAFPGNRVLDRQATSECTKVFSSYIGMRYYRSVLRLQYITPARLDWDAGVRLVVCVAFKPTKKYPEGSPLYASIRGSAN